jgi:pimeloyl-ACP methyl ester carboxylesterase
MLSRHTDPMSQRGLIGLLVASAIVVASCGASEPSAVAPPGTLPESADEIDTINESAVAGDEADRVADDTTRCIVRLHGKSGSGRATTSDDEGLLTVMPTGNEDGWGGRQWIYFPERRYEEARDVVSSAIAANGCGQVVINGFSNGAAFAASMFCSGETFNGVVKGYVIDDPVTDTATDGCAPTPDVDVVMYWTTAIAQPPGTDCAVIDWTCAGGTTIDVAAYAANLGTAVTPSPFTDHQWFWDAPEITTFLNA